MGPSSPYKRDDNEWNSQPITPRETVQTPRGRFGEASKVKEEFEEWEEANSDGYKVLEQVELVDLVGAIIGYAEKKFNIDADSLLKEAKAKNRTMSKKRK